MAQVYLSLGSAAENRAARLDEAERRISALTGTTITSRSTTRVAAAATAGSGRQPEVHYRVLGIATAIKARALLASLIDIEAAMGRDHRNVWAPRPIDLDILAYDDIEIRSSRLHLPHAFAHSRPFIIESLREIAPAVAEWVVRVNTRPR